MVFSCRQISRLLPRHCFTPLWGRRPSIEFERNADILEVSVRRNGPSPLLSVHRLPRRVYVSQAYHHAKDRSDLGFEINYRPALIGDIRICLGICELFEGGTRGTLARDMIDINLHVVHCASKP